MHQNTYIKEKIILALTNNNLEMIKAIANNDVNTAKKAALASLTEDTSKKNAILSEENGIH